MRREATWQASSAGFGSFLQEIAWALEESVETGSVKILQGVSRTEVLS
jgi:hypothetical protein